MAGYVVALTGASGIVYGLRLIDVLLRRGDDVDLIISPSGFQILRIEAGLKPSENTVHRDIKDYLEARWGGYENPGRLSYTRSSDLLSSLASGSSLRRAVIICPCSMGTLARIACGVSGNLIERVADCVLKERGILILVPRETPLNTIHLENMLRLSRMGAVVLPAMPGFYPLPESVDDMVDFIVGRILDILRIENNLYRRWRGDAGP